MNCYGVLVRRNDSIGWKDEKTVGMKCDFSHMLAPGRI
jgi:hypothetical protein